MDSHRNRYVLWLALLMLLAFGLAFAFWPRPVEVEAALVTHGPMSVSVDEEGEARYHDVYDVSAPVAGDVERIEIKAGDKVAAGKTVIAAFRPANPSLLDVRTQAEREANVKAAEAAVSLAKAQLDSAKAELEFARSDLARAKGLKAGEAISQRERERLSIAVKSQTATVQAAAATLDVRQAELDAARAGLMNVAAPDMPGAPSCCVEIKSPISGPVLKVFRESEGPVQAGQPLVEIGKSNHLEVWVDLLSTDAVRVRPGAKVAIDDWGGNQVLAGHVRLVEPYAYTKVSALGIEEQRVNVYIDFDEPAAALARLGHGYRVEARIQVWHSGDAVMAPLAAIFRDGNLWKAFVIENGHARERTIKVGERNTHYAQILSGVKPGDHLIIHPPDTVEDGTLVKARAVAPAPASSSMPQGLPTDDQVSRSP